MILKDIPYSADILLADDLSNTYIPIAWLDSKKLANVTISAVWKWIDNKVEKLSTINTLTLDEGFTVSCNAAWKWNITNVLQVAPTSCSGDFSTELPKEDIWKLSSFNNIVSTSIFKQTIIKEKTGMEVDSTTVIKAKGNDLLESSISVNLLKRGYFGYSTTNIPAEVVISALETFFSTSRYLLKLHITATAELYTIYAYPYTFGLLLSAKCNDTYDALGSFKKHIIEIKNLAGKNINCYMYISDNRKAFTDSTIIFK